MIDLHLHTTASDGSLSPSRLVARAAAAGITTLSITDHDTTAGLGEARATASFLNLTFVNGIEITAVEDERDVHVLGYFIDEANAVLEAFLDRQRIDRVRRVEEMGDRLASLGCPIDVRGLLEDGTQRGRSIGRPHVADALISAGHVRSRDEAFARFLEKGRPAFVPRRGASAADVIAILETAGGIASLAHPGLTRCDELIPALAAAGLAALEARHGDHDPETEARYRALASKHGLAVSGGSDFHSDDTARAQRLGVVTLSPDEWQALQDRRP
ncbi:MAG TPA: PHP domain-containing protein [Vicinamibacterales bacterium]|nr:PHP domain-containing protein [Vicinamibacterales bacterium]